jgi:Tfp pilus assembly PilM family ATPase
MTRALGIDIGNHSIKLAEIEYNSKSRELVGLYEIPRAPNDNVVQLITDFMSKSQIKAERIAVGMGQAAIYAKKLSLPVSKPKDYIPAVTSELEDTLPFDFTNDCILDIQKEGKSGNLTQFLVGVSPKEFVEKLAAICEQAAIVPNAFLIDSQALGEMALHQGLPAAHEDTSFAVVDFGSESTKMSILMGYEKDPHDRNMKESSTPGFVADFRAIPFGSKELIRWIGEQKSISEDDAKQWLIHRAEIKMEAGAESVVDNLSEELKVALRPVVVEMYQAIQAFKGVYASQPSALYLTGGMSEIKGFKEFLADELRLPVYSWPIFLGYQTEKVPLTPEKEQSFAVALSLAHRFVLGKRSSYLNFRRSQGARSKLLTSTFETLIRPEYKWQWLSAICFFAFLITYSMVATYYLEIEKTSLIKSAADEYRRFDKDAGKAADKFAESVTDISKKFEQKKKQKTSEIANRTKTMVGVPKSQLLLDLSRALTPSVKLISFTSNGPGSPDAQFEAIVDMPLTATESEINRLVSQIEKPLKERGYTLSLDKSPDFKKLTIKASIKGDQS